MSKSLRGHFPWLVGGVVSASLLGACGVPEEQAGDAREVSAPEATAGELTVRLSTEATSFGVQNEVRITVTLTNTASHPVKVLQWHTPVDGLKEDLFEVTRDGAPVAYVGRHYKRPAPQENDFLTLAPGESLTRTVDLNGAYDLTQTGSYSIRYASEPHHPSGAGHNDVARFASDSVTVWVEGRANPLAEFQAQGTVTAAALSYSGACTSTEQSSISSAFSSAKTYATNSLNYLSTTTPGNTARYKTWFGNYTSTNWNTAKTHFSKIKSAFDTQSVVVDCSCNDSAYAYVYPSSPYKIYVCNAFWSAPTTGTDSKAGTLVHEMSHFTVVAATDDHAYGQTACKNLAISSPTRALDNADSHEYFAENTPALQ